MKKTNYQWKLNGFTNNTPYSHPHPTHYQQTFIITVVNLLISFLPFYSCDYYYDDDDEINNLKLIYRMMWNLKWKKEDWLDEKKRFKKIKKKKLFVYFSIFRLYFVLLSFSFNFLFDFIHSDYFPFRPRSNIKRERGNDVSSTTIQNLLLLPPSLTKF